MNVARQKNPAMTRRRISKWLGIATTSLKDEALARIKSLLITARRNGDDSQCAVLSNVKEFVKRRFPKKCDVEGCPVVVQSVSRCCFVHSLSKAKTILLLAGLCVSCKTEQQQVKILRAPVPVALADIPQRAISRSVVSNQLAVVPSPLKPITLAWDWNTPEWFARSTDVYVYSSQNLKTWTIKTNSICLATRTNCPTQFVFANDRPMEFYQVLVTNVSMRKGWFVTIPNTK